jgi:signal peptidase I
MRKVTHSQIIKLIITLVLYIAFLIWVRSWWGIIVIPFIYDIYITKYVKWSFWKKAKDATVRSIMSWVDAIIFALVAVYFVNIYIFQNYQIPSSSLEKSLLVGDFLYVSKMSYGPRVPNTPLSMPLTQHTLPIFNCKSYFEWPHWDYKRVAGFGKVKHGDIVVFNFPAGDTVALNNQQTDFYSLAYNAGRQVYPNYVNMDSLTRRQQRTVYDLYYAAGRTVIFNSPEQYGKVIYRPVDRRENYVKRCIGLPGDVLMIRNREVYINGNHQITPTNAEFIYKIEATGVPIPLTLFRQLGLSSEDLQDYDEGSRSFAIPLTDKAVTELKKHKDLIVSIKPIDVSGSESAGLYPQNLHTHWTVDNYGPIWIPAKGKTITLNDDNLPIYERCIRAYEGNKLEQKNDGSIYINGVKTNHYTFKMDYYWMMGDNRHNSADSRYWGFVPEDHIVGKPIFIWLSLDKDRSWFGGKIRWGRMFHSVSSLSK